MVAGGGGCWRCWRGGWRRVLAVVVEVLADGVRRVGCLRVRLLRRVGVRKMLVAVEVGGLLWRHSKPGLSEVGWLATVVASTCRTSVTIGSSWGARFKRDRASGRRASVDVPACQEME